MASASAAAAALGDWTAPTHPLWMDFRVCIECVVQEWDVLRSAVDGGWGDGNPRQNEAKLLDDLCANFAHAWIANKPLAAIEVTNFFVGTLDDLFDCDIDSGVVTPVSQLLVRLYDEVTRGVDTGIKTVQARFDAKTAQAEAEKAAAAAEKASTQRSTTTTTTATAGAAVGDDGDTNMDISNGVASADTAAADDDGWETVPVRRGRGAKNRR